MRIEELSPQMKGAKTRLLKLLEKRLKIAGLNMEGRSKGIAFSGFNNNSGRLRQSIGSQFQIVDGKPTIVLRAGGQFGGRELKYARFIEFGTKYIGERRFLGRSMDIEKNKLQPKLQDLLRTALIERT